MTTPIAQGPVDVNVRAQEYEPPTYQHYDVMNALKDALRPHLKDGDMLIWRDAFRWKNDDGVLSNHYEMLDLPQLCADFGYEIVHDFCHVAVVRSNALGEGRKRGILREASSGEAATSTDGLCVSAYGVMNEADRT